MYLVTVRILVHRVWGDNPRLCTSNKIPGDIDTAGVWMHFKYWGPRSLQVSDVTCLVCLASRPATTEVWPSGRFEMTCRLSQMMPIVSPIFLQLQSLCTGASWTLHSSGALSEHAHLFTRTWGNVWVPWTPYKARVHLSEYNFTLLYHLPPFCAISCVILEEVRVLQAHSSSLAPCWKPL